MNMTIDKLYAYAKGIVSIEEKKTMRKYLLSHPEKLELVAKLMDDDNISGIDRNKSVSCLKKLSANSFQNIGKNPPDFYKLDSGFDKRLSDLLDELK